MKGVPDVAGQSDRDLVLAFQAGDGAAYDELYRRHHDRVARVCHRFLNSTTDAEEAVQETFLRAFQALPRFNGQFQVGAWLARIASNVCVDQLRVKSRSHLVALPSEDRIALAERGPEEILVGEHPELDAAMQDIQPLHANALMMRALDGLSHVEIGGRLNMTPSQVKALLHRARSSFKRALGKAQGWLLAPIYKARSLDRSSQISSTSSNLALFSAQAPAIAEKAAASVLIVMVALSGAPATSSATPEAIVKFPGVPRVDVPKVKARAAHTEVDAPHQHVAAEEPAPAAGSDLTALPTSLTSTIEGQGNLEPDEDTPDPGKGDDTLPPEVKEAPGETSELLKDVLENIDE